MAKRTNKGRSLSTPPSGLAMDRIGVGPDQLVVFSFPALRLEGLSALTEIEREVALEVLAGRSTAAIAAARQRSPRTIANQLASIFRKLGVKSRAELVALIGHSGHSGDR